jgi:hypothetical protein
MRTRDAYASTWNKVKWKMVEVALPTAMAVVFLTVTIAMEASAQSPQTCVLMDGRQVPCQGVLTTPGHQGSGPRAPAPGTPIDAPPLAPLTPGLGGSSDQTCWRVGVEVRCRSR